jgi:glycine betaine catabolism A
VEEFRRARVAAGARPLSGRYYSSEQVFALEQERIFRGGWVCVGRADEISAPGDYRLAEVGEESLILVRDTDATPRAYFNVCRHRGTRLCVETRGRFAGAIRCPYHGWTYSLEGELLAARHTEGLEGFCRSDYPLEEARIAEWEGFLFLNLAQEPEPFVHAFPMLADRFAAWGLPALQTARRIEYEIRANWKLIVENYSECYHCPLVHPALTRLSPPDSGRNDMTEGPVLGGYMILNPESGSMTLSGRTPRPPLPGLPAVEHRRVYYYAVFPNLLLSLHPDYVMAHFLWPGSAGETRIVCEWYFDPATMSAPGFDAEDAVEFWDRTNREDWQICERTQLGVRLRVYTPGPYTHGEGLPWAFDREYLRRLGDQGAL